MKVIVLHADGEYIEVVPVESPSAEMIQDGSLEIEDWLRETGRDTDFISWWVFENEIPVFWDKENIPFVTL